MKTPDEQVTERIIGEFRKSELLSEEGIKKIQSKLVAGKLTAEDWRFSFEVDRASEEKDSGPKD